MTGRLYGRDDLIDRVARSEAALTAVTGDSGVGKTRVLEAAAGPREGWIASEPRRFASSSRAVQQGLLEALGDIVAELGAEQGSINNFGDRLAGAADRMVKENVRELGRVMTAELLEIVRGRLGPEFGKALGQYVSKLREEMDATLAARLVAAADESTADVLAALAAEVAEFAGDRRVALYFDAGERLNEEEARILADLSERVPERLHIRVAFATFSEASAKRVADLVLLAPATHEIRILPLDESVVAEWLDDAAAQVPVGRAMKVTGGYPLHIGDLVRDVELGATVEDVPLNEHVSRRAEAAWESLPAKAAAVARMLCVLEDPLPEPSLRALVGLDPPAFATAVEALVRARIFPTEVAGRPWFHEQRRAFVRKKLTPDELDEASTRAAEAVWRELEGTDDPRFAASFADLANTSLQLRSADQKLAAALDLDEPEHAVMAAIVELMTPQNKGACEADELFRHARRFSDAPLDPLGVLESLESAGLVVTASNDHSTAVVPVLTARAVVALEGRAYRHLKRSPVPQLSTLVFQVGLQPRLGAFTQARFGIGRPSIGGLARTAGGGDPEMGYGANRPDRKDPGIHLLGRGSYADRPIWVVASYEDASDRDGARSELSDLDIQIFGDSLRVDDLFDHPWEVVPEQRFAKAAARAAGLTSFEVRETGDINVPLTVPLDSERARELRVETAKAVRDLASPTERIAMDLDEPFALYWDEAERSSIECTVYGGVESAVRVPGLTEVRFDSRYNFFEIEQRLELDENARLQNLNAHWGQPTSNDPVFAEIARRRNRAFLFNSGQPERLVLLDESSLEELTLAGFSRLMADARTLAELMVSDTVPLPPAALYVYVLLEHPVPGWVPGCGSRVIAIECESPSADDEVFFSLSRADADVSGFIPRVTGDIDALFKTAFGFAAVRGASGFLWGSRAHDVASLLAEYAGFHESDLALRWPTEV